MIIVIVFAIGCSTVKIPVGEQTVIVKSHIPEKHRLVPDKPITFMESPGAQSTQEFWPDIVFTEPGLKNAGFDFNVETTNINWAISDPGLGAYDKIEAIDSINTSAYSAMVWKVGSSHPAFAEYEHEFKFISVRLKQGDFYITAENISNFKDSITPQFVAQKLSELEFTVKPKN